MIYWIVIIYTKYMEIAPEQSKRIEGVYVCVRLLYLFCFILHWCCIKWIGCFVYFMLWKFERYYVFYVWFFFLHRMLDIVVDWFLCTCRRKYDSITSPGRYVAFFMCILCVLTHNIYTMRIVCVSVNNNTIIIHKMLIHQQYSNQTQQNINETLATIHTHPYSSKHLST